MKLLDSILVAVAYHSLQTRILAVIMKASQRDYSYRRESSLPDDDLPDCGVLSRHFCHRQLPVAFTASSSQSPAARATAETSTLAKREQLLTTCSSQVP